MKKGQKTIKTLEKINKLNIYLNLQDNGRKENIGTNGKRGDTSSDRLTRD